MRSPERRHSRKLGQNRQGVKMAIKRYWFKLD